MILLKTQRLIIRSIDKKDISPLLDIYNKEENMRYVSTGKYDWTYTELVEKYTKFNMNYRKGYGIFVVQLQKDREIIGEAGLFNSFNNLSKLELGYIIDSKHWNNGYGKEVCKALIDYAFNQLKTNTLIARMYANNTASVKLSESCHMTMVNEEVMNNNRKIYVYQIENY